MAKVRDQHLGAIRGKVGDSVFKMYGPNSFVGKAPKEYKKTTSEMLIYNRKRFPTTSAFASAINDSRYLKRLWESSEYKGKTPFHKVCDANYHTSRAGFMNVSARIVPDIYKFDSLKLNLNESVFKVEFGLSESLIASFPAPYLFVGFIQLSNPLDKSTVEKSKQLRFLTIEEPMNDFAFENDTMNKFSFSAPENSFRIINDYSLVIAYFAIISRPQDDALMDEKPKSFHKKGTIIKGKNIYDKDLKKFDRINDDFNEKKAEADSQKDIDEPGFVIRVK